MSGQGASGGRPNCWNFWHDYSRCAIKATSLTECTLEAEDYKECLHHTKEMARAMTIRQTYADQLHAQGKSKTEIRRVLNDGVNPTVGLIEGEFAAAAAK